MMKPISRNPYKDVIVDSICSDIKKVRDSGVLAGTVILILSAIDAMGYLSMPLKQKDVHRNDYIKWVDEYMKTDEEQPYQYRGIDMYGARCGIIHRYGVESSLSEQEKCKVFAYNNGSKHYYNPAIDKKLVILSIRRLSNDFFKAIEKFLHAAQTDAALKARIDSRILKLFIMSKRDDHLLAERKLDSKHSG